MKPVAIDFAPRSALRTVWRTTPGNWVILGIGVFLCVGAGLAVAKLRLQQQAYEAERRAGVSSQKVERTFAGRTAVSPEKAIAINNAVAQLNVPWLDMHDAIMGASTPGVALLVLEPQVKQHTIKIAGEAKTIDDVLLYVEQLKHQPFLMNVMLVKHSVSEQDPNKPLRFQLEAQWGAAGNRLEARQ
jgi:hypothetical protein